MSLTALLTLETIKSLAGEKSFARGLAYFHDGVVGLVEEKAGRIQASVQGTHRYRVVFSVEDDKLVYECNCPVGNDGEFCKHAVAVALSWLESSGEEVFHADETLAPKKKRITKADQLRNYLDTLSENELRDLLMEAADRDRNFRDKLLFAAKSTSSKGVASLRSIINQATKVSGRADWQDAYDYAERLNDLADLLEKRIEDGEVKLVELIEEAIIQAERGQENVDDSDGESYASIEHLREVHWQACQRLQPDPVALAERLFNYQMAESSDVFYAILPAYIEVLGEQGVARYEALITEKWNKLPKLGSSSANRQPWDSHSHRLERAMTELAKQRGDIETLIAIKSRDLSSPHNFLQLAQFFKEQKRFDEALSWAEKGLTSFPKESRLGELQVFAIEEYLRRNDPDAVEKLAWQRFEQQPGSAAFFELLKTAKQINRLDSLRQQALNQIETRIAKEEKTGAKPSVWSPCSRNTLLEIHLAEKNADAMWATLKGGLTSSTLWERCAAMRGESHPEDAISLYFKLLPMAVSEGSNNARYESAFRIVQAIGKLRRQQDRAADFKQELARIRLEYKAKRNFIKLLSVLG